MNYDRVHALFSRASEAIVAEDGTVKRRLNNYETIVGSNPQDPFYVPVGAVNDNYGNLNFRNLIAESQAGQQTATDGQLARINLLRYAMYATAVFVVLGFIWSLTSFIGPTTKSITDDTDYRSHVEADIALIETQLERVANLVIRDGEWSKTRIELFQRYWNRTDFGTRETFKTKAWYQHFTYRLKHRIKQDQSTGNIATAAEDSPTQLLLGLALALGVESPIIQHNIDDIESPDETIYKKLATEVSTELARVEEKKIDTLATSSGAAQSEAALNAQLMAQMAGTVPQVPAETQKAVNQKVKADVKATSVSVAAINEKDVARVLEKYSSAYEHGNLQELSTLFGVNDVAEGEQIIAQLKTNYENIFSNSHKRSVSFNGLNWRIQGNNAVVNSDYTAKMQLNNNKGVQTVSGQARLELSKSSDQTRIASFELLNRKVNVIAPEIRLSATTPAAAEKPAAPTAAELQDVVTRLVAAYESGDLETFTGLFTRDARTNDRTDIKGIRQDYQELFRNSSDRQMFIQGMNWSYENNHAKGSGDLEAIVLSRSGDPVYTMNGKVQIVAQRIDGKVLITHLYHLERSK